MIYMDSAATSYQKPEEVVQAVADALRHTGNAGRGAHEASLDTSRLIYSTRVKLSRLFGLGNPQGVAFTGNSTESLNIAVQGMFEAGDHVITTELEHNSVLRPLYLMQGRGVGLTIIPADRCGNIDYGDMGKAVRTNTKAIVCTHVSNLTGNATDIGRVGEICSRYGLYFILDASQSAGVFDIDMHRDNIAVLCFTGHKGLYGPQGTGGIAVKDGVVIRPLAVGGSGMHSFVKEQPSAMPEVLEAGTLNGHGIAGLCAGISFIESTGQTCIRHWEQGLMRRFYRMVSGQPGIRVYGDFAEEERGAIVALNIGDCDSSAVADELYRSYGICTRAGAHCAPLLHKALGTADRGAVRFSFSYFNTEEEVDLAAGAVCGLGERKHF